MMTSTWDVLLLANLPVPARITIFESSAGTAITPFIVAIKLLSQRLVICVRTRSINCSIG
ncbi:hypothetical protein THIOM_004386 [Candidatus Thiomargarita nelsonii]|uniref:Uncharacterized protein n=1 Tax=Candidatus Thiomargarita nelsonii TaxID=1003181 RepID=A0A176RW06_9GAMM|nr:hypothetical protein THIOM_004386 [Candidatus Thiomargarita nelsonii]